jgi:predicted MFS family arabinose efflux permease
MTFRLPRAAAFWLLAATLDVLLFASTAPSPLYGAYQARWGFSALTLTVVFGVFALALLATLVTARAQWDERAGLVAAILTVAYLAFSVPAVLAGLAVTRCGLREATYLYGAGLILAAGLALALSRRMHR